METSNSCPCCVFTLPKDFFLPQDHTLQQTLEKSEELGVIDPGLALERLNASNSVIADTHSHAHLDRQAELDSSETNPYAANDNSLDHTKRLWILSCAVAPGDWANCLDYASRSSRRLAALGVHPWYLDQLLVEGTLTTSWLQDLEGLIQKHPYCFVGEIGLCKRAKFVRTYPGGKVEALALQRTVMMQQMELAARYQRPVSIHCVDQHAALLQILKDMSVQHELLPPAVALHSFTGTSHHVQLLLDWEASLSRDPADGPLLYFGFSHSINYLGSIGSEKARRQNALAIQKIPQDRLLAESDVHQQGHVAAGTAGAIAYLTWALQQSHTVEEGPVDCKQVTLESIAQLTSYNATRYFAGLKSKSLQHR